jgi:hypothetical protein
LYAEVQSEVVLTSLKSAPSVIPGLDGATNFLSRSMSNVIAHDPRPWFIEYLRADLKKESEVELSSKIVSAITRFDSFVGKQIVAGFISDSCNVMRAVRRRLVLEDHN